jgi:hypothetical protein
MIATSRAIAALFLLLSACRDQPTPPAPPVSVPSVPLFNLLEGDMPPGPEADLARAKCQICHTTEYITQQRLTPAQWEKTIAKMKKWGAPLTDDEERAMVAYFSKYWTTELGERRAPPVKAPQ